jgi:hypothetical protein
VPAAGEQPQEAGGLVGVAGLAEAAPAERHHGVGREHHGVAVGRRRRRLGRRQPERAGARQLGPERALVDLGGDDGVGDDPDLGEQLAATRARGGEDQARGFVT